MGVKGIRVTAIVLISALILSMSGRAKGKSGIDYRNVSNGLVYDESSNSWSTNEDDLKGLAEILKEESENFSGSGGIVMLASDEKVIFISGSERTETDGNTKVNAYTTYEIGSVTKTFTATAILQLCEQGKLSLDDKLGTYIPEYEKGKDITLRQIIHMKSGIQREFFSTEELMDFDLFIKYYNDGFSDEELIEVLNRHELEFEPGTQSLYSNTGYTLLAMVIEKITGEKYCDYIQKNIFDECGMEHSSSMTLGDVTSVPKDPPFGYYNFDINDVFPDGYFMCPVSGRGAGDIHSCAADMIAFDNALFSGKLINSDSLAEMFSLDMGYGCGWQEIPGYKNCYGHAGATGSYYSLNMVIKTEEYGTLYLIELFPYIGAGQYVKSSTENLMNVL